MINDNDENNIIEADFTPIEKTIRGQALYFSTSQVAEILGESDSKIRYYTKEFDSLFDEGDIEISNKQRRYTQKSIDKLKYFVELKNEGLTIKQIREYCEEVEWDEEKGVIVKESTPLHVQTIATALMEEQSKQMEEFKKDISQKLLELMTSQVNENIKLRNQLKKEVALTVDEVLSEKLNEHLSKINNELEITKETNEKVDRLRELMEHRKEESEKNENKGFFSRFRKR